MLPSLPLGINFKIASALGALGGGLTGAAIGGTLGGLEGFGAGTLDQLASDHGNPDNDVVANIDPARLVVGEHDMQNAPPGGPGALGGLIGAGGGALAGGAIGTAAGAMPRQMSPNQSMGDHKMASKISAIEYFKLSGSLGRLGGGLLGVGIGGAVGGQMGHNYDLQNDSPSNDALDTQLGAGLGAAVAGVGGAALGDALTSHPMGRRPIIGMGPDGKPVVTGFQN